MSTTDFRAQAGAAINEVLKLTATLSLAFLTGFTAFKKDRLLDLPWTWREFGVLTFLVLSVAWVCFTYLRYIDALKAGTNPVDSRAVERGTGVSVILFLLGVLCVWLSILS